MVITPTPRFDPTGYGERWYCGKPEGAPPHAPGSISFNATTGAVTAPYTIAASASATVGLRTFQVQYDFHDAAHTSLATHTLQFVIDVLP